MDLEWDTDTDRDLERERELERESEPEYEREREEDPDLDGGERRPLLGFAMASKSCKNRNPSLNPSGIVRD